MKKDDYFIKIKPEFLFDEYEVFESNYTPWVYLSIKHKYNYNLDKAPNKLFTIDKHALAGYYATTPATIYKAIKELKAVGLLEEKKRKFRLIHENEYLRKFRKVDTVNENKYPDFIKVYNNAYDDLLLSLKKEILPTGKNKRLIFSLNVYYYLMANNRHCLLKEVPLLESDLTQTSLEKEIGPDHKVLKYLLSVLNDTGYIKIEPGRIFTLDKKIYDPEKHWIKSQENGSLMTPNVLSPNEIVDSNLTDQGNLIPEYFIGYKKLIDGKIICVIYYNTKYKKIMLGGWCAGDGISPTPKEITISTDLFAKGKMSKYYDPNIFWKYEPENESFSNVLKVA